MLRRLLLPPTDWLPASFHAEEPEPVDYTLLRFSRRAMATRFEIALPFGTPNALDAAEAALDLIDDLEDQLTVYREDSEVSRLNATAFDRAVQVEKNLFDLLQLAARLAVECGGAFDIASGSLIKVWGFHRREGRVPTPREHAAAMQASGSKHLILDEANHTVRFRRRGLELNLGSIGKGYALDRAGELLRARGIRSALLHAGGSSVLAIGAAPNDPRGWPIDLAHPANPERSLGRIRLRNAGLGTTAATYQQFEHNGKNYGHIIDPRSGWPAEGTASATAVASRAAEADAHATADFILGRALRSEARGVILPAGDGVRPHAFGLAAEYDSPNAIDSLRQLLTFPEPLCTV